MPSIFFGPPKSSRVLAWQRVLEESSFPQASLESKEAWPGGLLKDRSGAQALVPFLKRVHSSPFLASLVFKQGEGVELSFPERKVRGWGLPKQEKGGLRVGCKAEAPLKRPWTFQASFTQGRPLRWVSPGSLQVV